MADGQSESTVFVSHWSDHLLARIDALPLPRTLFYLLLFFLLGLTLNLILWLAGGRESGVLDFNLFLPGFWLTAYLMANHVLVLSGRSALNRATESNPVLNHDLDWWMFQIGHIPHSRAQFWLIGGILLGAGTALYAGLYLDLAFDLPIAFLVLFSMLGTALFFLAIFRIIHQMDILVEIFSAFGNINLFDLSSVYSLTLFPAKIVLILLLTFWVNPIFLMFPNWLKDPWMQALWIAISLGASAVVISPLQGIRTKVSREKDALLKENADLLNAVRKDLSDLILKGDHDQANALEKEISALFAFRESLESISTMPWKRETIRWLATALLLPLSLWIIQFLLQRLLGG